jgi:hypothetical protein
MTVSSSRTPVYGEPAPDGTERMPWPRVIARMILVILPGLLIGSFAGGVVVTVVGVQLVRSAPSLTLIIPVLTGLITGLGLGLVIKPFRDWVPSLALVSLAITAAADIGLLILARLRVSAAAVGPPLSGQLLGVLIVVVVQTAVSLPLWLRRTRASVG